MSKGVSIAFKLTALVLLLGILGVSIGILIVNLNIRDDVEATPAVPSTTVPSATAPISTVAQPEDPDNIIPPAPVIKTTDKRFAKFQEISDLFGKWMDVKVDPCDDFYHYVCGKGQKNNESSPFLISTVKDFKVSNTMWQASATYWNNAPLPVKQAKWIRDRCHEDNTYTLDDQKAKQKEMMNQFISYTDINVPFLNPTKPTNKDKTALSKLIGYAKGQFGAFNFLTAFVSPDFKNPDKAPYLFYIDQPVPIFVPAAYQDGLYTILKKGFITEIVNAFTGYSDILGVQLPADGGVTLKKMASDVLEFDRVIATTMQQDAITRRQVERNYNPYTLADLNTKADQFDWVSYLQSAMVLLGDKANADGNTKVIIMEVDITLTKLNDLIKKTDAATIVNYIYYKTFSKIIKAVPPPSTALNVKTDPLEEYRATLNLDKKTLIGMLRKPDMPNPYLRKAEGLCGFTVETLLPWAATRMYVDTDIPDKDARAALKENVAEIANWIFFGFRSQLDQLNWMDGDSKQEAFDKLNKIQLNVAFPDWVTDDKALTDYYDGIGITENDNFMDQWIKLTNYRNLKEVEPIVTDPPRDRGDFSSFIGITNAWYQPQMNSITFPEGILQEPFYSPDYPLATIFGGLGSISGHELTHGFDDQGIQWDGIGALRAWMTKESQKSFNQMAQCVIDEYSSFCPFPGVCLNGANTQGENIADNGGIQAAYKALKAYESLKGPDPRLPGFASVFNSDQLFFLTFAQTWCDQDQDLLTAKVQIKMDVHSPSLYRVLGTIQNFPAFRNAFNCPVGKLYTPEKHCDVWTSMPF